MTIPIERWNKIEELFEAALPMNESERSAFLDEQCRGDAALRAEVESLIAHRQPTGVFLSTMIRGGAAQMVAEHEQQQAQDNERPRETRFLPGALLAGRYRIVGLLGRGGMGEVYRADDLKLGQTVALKFIPEQLARDPRALQRFHAEVRTARQVSHPNVCRVFDIGEVEGQHFLSMEYIDGEDLARLLRRIGRLPEDKAIDIARQLCAGLAAIHAEGVLHRDLKPANVMLDGRGRARITDFGLAGLADELNDEGRAGTPVYMAPEQLAGGDATVRSDLYALGMVLYEILTGRRPFVASTLADLIHQHDTTTPPSLSGILKEIDPKTERVVLRCLAREPEARPASAATVAAGLPGGDALQFGTETPSPEMVAAAPREGSLTPAAALACFAAIIVSIVLLCVGTKEISLLRIVDSRKSPEVLADRAAGIAAKLGYDAAPADTAHGFDIDHGYVQWVGERDRSPRTWEVFRERRPAAMRFWYRQSPEPLAPAAGVVVDEDDPPPLRPGMVNVLTDVDGRLLRFEAVPSAEATPRAMDWRPLFAEAGLEMEAFRRVEPRSVPSAFADDRAAWEGTFGRGIPMRVEAASFGGRPVFFELRGPWREAGDADTPTDTRFFGVIFVVFAIAIVTGALLARRNWRMGRGDRKGALRLAVFVAAASFLGWLFGASHVASFFDELRMLWLAAGAALMHAGIIWILYLALEPYVRRRSPQRIISWTRLVGGNWRDPMVGRDILIGALVALGGQLVILQGAELAGRALGQPAHVETHGVLMTLDGASEIARIFLGRQFFMSLLHGLGYVFLLLLMTLLLRRERLAALGLWLLMMMPFVASGGASPATFVFEGIIIGTIVIVVARFGLLAMVSLQFFYFMFRFYAWTSDPTAWYFGHTLFAVLVCVAITGFCCYTSMGGRSLIPARLLED